MNKKAFTLAEVLMAFIVIGIVAVLTLSFIFAGYQEKEREAKVRKAYTTISNAMSMLKVTGEDAILEELTVKNGSKQSMNEWFNLIEPKLSTSKVCYETKGCWCDDDTKTLNGKIVSFDSNRPGKGLGTDIVSVILNDGMYASFNIWDEGDAKNVANIEYDGASVSIAVDINGDKKPNTIGKDIFYMVYIPGRGLVPPFADANEEKRAEDCTKAGNGLSCTLKYLRE